MKIFDSHAHLNENAFDSDFEKVIERSLEKGVKKIIVPGYDVESSCLAVRLSEKYPDLIYASVGIHPHDADGFEKYIVEIEALIKEKNVVGVGETGLDYYRNYFTKEKQIDSFIAHIHLAKKHRKPLIIHIRKAFNDVFAILKKYKGLQGVFHCLSGGKEEADFIQKRGFYISFSGSITYDSKKLIEALKNTSLDRLLIETDAPYLTPRPLKGRCEPSYIVYTLERISLITGISVQEIASKTFKNTQSLFKLT